MPREIADPQATAAALARELGLDASGRRELLAKLQKDSVFQWVERKVAPATAQRIRSLQLPGVGLVTEHRRYYPQRELAAQVLGYVGVDNQGMAGLEYLLDDDVRGRGAKVLVYTDARRRPFAQTERPSTEGASVMLALDEAVQYIAERELDRSMAETQSVAGMVIVVEPFSGEMLAMAQRPGFNPNRYKAYPSSHWRNRAVADVFEPGSIFKIVTAAAGLQEGVVSPDEVLDCGHGHVEIAGITINDHAVYDQLTFSQAVWKSSDIGMIRVAQRLGRDNFERYVRRFGFGSSTGVDLPAESPGLLRPQQRWSALSLPSMSFGQEIGVTGLQVAMATAAVANGGYLMKPLVVRRVEDASGHVVRASQPVPVRRVLEPATVDTLTEILRGVVREGTGRRAAVPGYEVAGKTGTAQKIDASGRYSMVDHVASFVGFVPAMRPALVIVASLDTPRGAANQGGDVAAPLFSRVARGRAARAGSAAGRPEPGAAGAGDRVAGHGACRLPAAADAGADGRGGSRGRCDARPARPLRARGRDRRGAPRPGGRAARDGPRSDADTRAGERRRAGQHLRADPRPGGGAAMTLGELLTRLPAAELHGDSALPIADVTHDSRHVVQGALFVAIPGLAQDGNRFVEAARRKGAVAVVSEEAPQGEGTWVRVDDARAALALLSAAVLGEPARQLDLVGVTGTNGKTTTAYLVDSAVRAAGETCGLLGTIEYRLGDRVAEAVRTTPESSDLQRLFRQMVDAGCSRAVLEVSSHSLALRRVHGLDFKVAVFTNLTRDHLDFHGDMDRYFAAKRLLFETRLRPDGHAIVNLDDDRAPELVRASRGTPWTYSAGNPAADVFAEDAQLSLEGTRLRVRTPLGPLELETSLIGRFNVQNMLAAAGAALALGLPKDAVARGFASLRGVPGRMERVSAGQPFTVLVDYAHTDDALKNLLETVRGLGPQRITTVFGCGGDRDRTKRPLMGMVASRLSDRVVLTSDNPRSEPPEAILDEIRRGIPLARAAQTLVLPDRREAITRALEEALPGDAVVIAGKGHETYQALRERTVPFDDRQVAREVLSRLAGKGRP